MKVGDWVRFKDDHDIRGYVTKVLTAPPVEGFENAIHFMRQEKNGIYCSYSVKQSRLEADPVALRSEDIAALIDIALATNDKAWFKRLRKLLEVTK